MRYSANRFVHAVALVGFAMTGTAAAQEGSPAVVPLAPKAVTEQASESDALDRELQALSGQADYAKLRFDFDGAIDGYKQVLELKRKRFGEGDWRIADAELEVRDLQTEAAVAAVDREGVLELWRLNAQCKKALLGGQFERLQTTAEAMTAKADQLFGRKHTSSIRARGFLSQRYLYAGLYDQALPVLTEVLALADELVGEDHPERVRALSDLGSLERRLGNMEDAERRLTSALKYIDGWKQDEPFEGANLVYTRTVYNELADLYCQQGNWKRAAEYLVSFAEFEKEFGSGDLAELSFVVARQSDVELWRGDYAAAYRYYVASLRMSRESGSNSALATSLRCGISLWDCVIDEFRAVKLVAELDTIAPEQATPSDAPRFVVAFCSEGWHWILNGHFDRAINSYRHANHYAEPNRIAMRGLFYDAMRESAWACCDTGELDKAEKLLAMVPTLKSEAPISDRTAYELHALVTAKLRFRQDRQSEAVEALAVGLSTTCDYFGSDNLLLIPHLKLRLKLLKSCGLTDEASTAEKHLQDLRAKAKVVRAQLTAIEQQGDAATEK